MTKFIEATDTGFTSGAKVGAFKGVVQNLGNVEYHSLDQYWSSTDLKYMYANSPQHFYDKYFELTDEHPWKAGQIDSVKIETRKAKDQKRPSSDMILGSLVHCLILAPDDFQKEFFIMPDLNLRTNDGKAYKEKLITENPGKLWITDEDLAQGYRMKSSLMANPRAKELLEPGTKELAVFWTCPFSNLNFKAKLDQFSQAHFCELKTTSEAGLDAFSKHVDNMNYDLSLVHYQAGIKQALGIAPPAFFLVVEREFPHVSQVYPVGQGFWETGHAKWMDAVTKLEAGLRQKQWPGYFKPGDEPEIQPPPWALKKLQGENIGI